MAIGAFQGPIPVGAVVSYGKLRSQQDHGGRVRWLFGQVVQDSGAKTFWADRARTAGEKCLNTSR